MILTSLKESGRYSGLQPGFEKAFEFLRRPDLAELADGRHEIDGDKVFAVVFHGQGKGREGVEPEVHNRYIDVQFTVSGVDTLGWRDRATCREPKADFKHEEDWQLFLDQPSFWFDLPPGYLAIFFPEDVHAPWRGEGPLHKVVIKVKI